MNNETNLKKKMIIQVRQHFSFDSSEKLFWSDKGLNEMLLGDDHRTKLINCVANKFLTLRLLTYGKKYMKDIVNLGNQSIRHTVTLKN